ncbi:TonB-dependent receptor [Kingella potus]|nr:TonB-dependent receptor [Kingella potus]UOP01397.1 TonB-dependent receptor [Kingella potus]
MRWQPVTVVDAYLRYKISKNLSAELVGTNLTDRYYLDPLSRSYMPAPGRGIRLGISGRF